MNWLSWFAIGKIGGWKHPVLWAFLLEDDPPPPPPVEDPVDDPIIYFLED